MQMIILKRIIKIARNKSKEKAVPLELPLHSWTLLPLQLNLQI